MYIPAFWVGVGATILAEIIGIVIVAATSRYANKK